MLSQSESARDRRAAAPSAASGAASVLAVHAGKVGALPFAGRTIASAIAKRRCDGPATVAERGIDGDEHGDRRRHGGPDKALCVFPSEHYAHYARLLGRPLERPAFGENLTTVGLLEEAVCIGDVLEIGSVRCQVSLPRNPCYRVGAHHRARRLPLWMEESGRTGFYLRVLTPGRLAAGAPVRLVARPHPRLTVAEANRVMHQDRTDAAAIRALLVPELGASWRRTFERRLAGELEDPAPRRFGADDGASDR